jgi:DNA-binding NarL/FixJ family response regulator
MRQIKTVVIVENEPIIALDLQDRCEEAGFTVLAAARSVAQAEIKFVDLRPDVIITNMGIGAGGEGCVIVQAIRERCPDISVVFVTATIERSAVERISAMKPDCVLPKPLPPGGLEEALQALG